MKNNYSFVALFVAVLAIFATSCKKMDNVSVKDIAYDLLPGSVEGTAVRSKTVVDGLTMTITELSIIDAEKHLIEKTVTSYGHQVQSFGNPVPYTYEKAGLADGNLGVNYLFIPAEGEPIQVLYWGNGFIMNGDTIVEGKAPSVNLMKIADAFPNHKWDYSSVDYEILYDTITYMDTVITKVRRPDPITGKPIFVSDTTITKKERIDADTIGPKYTIDAHYEFARNAAYENTGSRNEVHTWYRLSADSTQMEFVRDSVECYGFVWGLNTVTSATRFALNVIPTGKSEALRVSVANLSIDKGSVEISSKAYKLND